MRPLEKFRHAGKGNRAGVRGCIERMQEKKLGRYLSLTEW